MIQISSLNKLLDLPPAAAFPPFSPPSTRLAPLPNGFSPPPLLLWDPTLSPKGFSPSSSSYLLSSCPSNPLAPEFSLVPSYSSLASQASSPPSPSYGRPPPAPSKSTFPVPPAPRFRPRDLRCKKDGSWGRKGWFVRPRRRLR